MAAPAPITPVPPPQDEKARVLATVEPGLNEASKLTVGSGTVAVDVQATSSETQAVDLKIDLKAEARLSGAVVVYGDAWAKPLDGKYGADVGAQILNNLDLYAGGWADTSGGWGAGAGVKLKF